MSLETFLTQGLDLSVRSMLYDKIPLFLMIFAAIFLLLMVLFFSVIKMDNLAVVGLPCFILALGSSWFIVRSFYPYGTNFIQAIGTMLVPLIGVTLVVVMVAQILKFLW